MPDFPTVHCTKFPPCPSLLPCRKFPRYFPGTPSLSSRNVPRGFAGHFPPIGFWESPPLLPSLFCSRKFPLHAPKKCHFLSIFPLRFPRILPIFQRFFVCFVFVFRKTFFIFIFLKKCHCCFLALFPLCFPGDTPCGFLYPPGIPIVFLRKCPC